MITVPDCWYVKTMTAEQFLLGMLTLGRPLDLSLVGAFDDQATPGRASRRDVDLPPHRDGIYSAELAAVQGGVYVAKDGIDYVGLYCLREGSESCYTTLQAGDATAAIDLRQGEALVFDNHALLHGRRGPVGDRVLLRVWIAANRQDKGK